MNIIEYLTKNKSTIIDKWLKSVISTYPKEAAKFFEQTDKQFSNPVGWTISEEIKGIYNALIYHYNTTFIEKALDNILKIRAVQEFTPAQALGFIFQLKKIIKDELADGLKDSNDFIQLLELFHQIDDLALKAFNLYMQARESLNDIKANESGKRHQKMFERISNKYEEMGD
jgi:hypothetical protein